MQRNGLCRRLWRSRHFFAQIHTPRLTLWLHTLNPSEESAQKDLVAGSTQLTEELRQKNCWKLWKQNYLTADQISHVLRLPRDAPIVFILKFEKGIENVDWNRLCKLVGLTTSTTQAIFKAILKAKAELTSISGNVNYDIKRFCSQNVTYFQIDLVHIMLDKGLKPSEILCVASLSSENDPMHYAEPGNGAENSVIAGARTIEESPSDPSWECYSGEESVNPKNTDLLSRNNQLLLFKFHEEGKAIKDFEDSTYDYKGVGGHETKGLADSIGPLAMLFRENSAALFNLLRWLQKHQTGIDAVEHCEALHMLLLLLDCLKGAIIYQIPGMVSVAYQQKLHRLGMHGEASLQNPHASARMHRALCLKVALLGVLIHVPQKNVEFIIRSGLQSSHSRQCVYCVHIFKHPSCTCPDFMSRVKAGYPYLPCKHLFYTYMVQLSIEKDLEHLMFRSVLTDEELERILVGYYIEIT